MGTSLGFERGGPSKVGVGLRGTLLEAGSTDWIRGGGAYVVDNT